MDLLHTLLNFILHLDTNLVLLVTRYGMWAYSVLFLIIFCETGLVVTPFLPGDSLIFATGALAANSTNAFNVYLLFLLLTTASILGNTVNYMIGKKIGPAVFHSRSTWLFNTKHLEKAHRFYEQHGGKTLILARFIPIIRTFAPFIAGIACMHSRRFFIYNLTGAILWIGGLLSVSYLFGNLPFVKQHFSTLMVAIIIISLLPPVIELMRQKCIKSSNCS